ncbi:MAG: peptide chain release factor N(5)-glutamine methyltransferase [Hyphomicrobiaceae bacterium]|nr:peptide chain release factor N(5)-glutamine methyltransferase [Hyphomicrobiaceae bacterium]
MTEQEVREAALGGPSFASLPETLGASVRWAAEALASAGIDCAGREARRLVAEVLGEPALLIVTEPARALSAGERGNLHAAVCRRRAGEPLSRILGRREFYGSEFTVTPATLDPRPDTECLVEAVLEVAAESGLAGRPIRFIDIGTGTGCIAISLLRALPAATALATDISADALAVARGNAERLGVADRFTTKLASVWQGVDGPFDFVVSNPPYIATGDIQTLDRAVRDFDPLAALDGGPDGLTVYREICAGLETAGPGAWVAFELGAASAAAFEAEAVRRLLQPWAAGPIRSWRDLSGHTRCVAVQTRLTSAQQNVLAKGEDDATFTSGKSPACADVVDVKNIRSVDARHNDLAVFT